MAAKKISDEAKRGIRRVRRKRLATGFNVTVAVLLAAVIAVLVNILAAHYHHRWDVSWSGYHKLSPRTLSLLSSLEGEVKAIAFLRSSSSRFNDIKYLLKEYEYAAARTPNLTLTLEFVDATRDVIRAGELAQEYALTEDGVVIFESRGRRKYVEEKDIFEQDIELQGRQAVRRLVAFRGEQVFSSAIQSVTQETRPVLYFLTGHGERAIDQYGKHSAGYSEIARSISRDNIELKPLLLAESPTIPKDCSVIVIAGPTRRFSQAEIDLLAKYLDSNGRLLVLVDSEADTGLEPLLKNWGLELGNDVVVGMTLTGRELVVSHYGEHPITRGLKNVATMFYRPRSVQPVPVEGGQAAQPDRPKVTILARTVKGWREMDLKQQPPRFDEGVDQPGPVGVAAAVERGPVKGLDVEIKPTRIVAIGDSSFVSNGALTQGIGGNRDFFMCAVNWLVEREALLAISPKPPAELRLDMDARQIRMAYLVMVGGWPVAIAVLGFFVWLCRRR